MADYLIKDIPEDKMKDFKTACAHYKVTMKEAWIDIMDGIIQRYKTNTGQLLAEYDRAKKKEKKK